MPRRLLPLLLLPALGCLHAPPIHPRAQENNAMCVQYLGQGDLIKADTYCDLALEFSPHYPEAWVNRGLIRMKRNQISDAKECFIKALHYNPDEAQAYNDLGFIYLKENAFGRAHDNFQHALKVNPDFTESRYNLALSYIGMKKPEGAKRVLRTLIAVAPQIADAHQSLGIVLEQEGDHQGALAEFNTAAQLDPNFDEAFLNLGTVYNELGRYGDAADAFASCVRANADNVACRNNLPIANRKKQLSDPGLKTQNGQVLQDPTPAGWYQLGQTHHERGLRAEEERDYRRCVELDGKYVPCHYGLFLIYKEDQNVRNANIACKNVVKFGAAEDYPKEVESCQKFLSKL